ncbi:YhcN/YlaJ family sporulation lipoprotein [Anaerobacillus sp. MEB173]|uniref:YhcN/YlaJ family sporulation lipoprotein n=1 Tax=Anaerobacillus sp. MEB173 TaxID=3383345 RepID=UPI003F908A62
MNKILLFVFAILILTGCQAGGGGGLQQGDVTPINIGKDAIVDQTKADNSKSIVASMEEVIGVKGVNLKEDIYIAVQVKQFDRLRLKHIRKTAFDKIKKRYPKDNIHVSTDKKIFMELEELEQKLKRNEITEKNLEKKVKKLEDDMKG